MVLSRFKSLLRGHVGPQVFSFDAEIAPNIPFYVIGDIHGCFDLLVQKISDIDQDRSSQDYLLDAPVVFIGDFLDRGSKSAEVLQLLFERSSVNPEKNICIFGNHEQMLIDFLDDPAGKGRRWLKYGGIETLSSFGILDIDENADLEELVKISSVLEQAMGDDLIAWIRKLPTLWKTGNVVCVHAGLDPQETIESQKKSTMVWGHTQFEKMVRDDGIWVVHGHTIFAEPMFHSGRISIDTGAYKGGPLTAVKVETGKINVI